MVARTRTRHSDERIHIPRAERVEAMRARLLEATLWCIVDKGYAATSTNDVVRRAKVSRGALAHHFPTKAALVNAAASHLVAKRALDFESRMAQLDADQRTPAAALDILWSFYEQPECRALVELSIAARHDSELRALMSTWDDMYIELLRTSATEFVPDVATNPHAGVLLRTITALYDGLGLYDMTQDDHRNKVAEVRTFFFAILTQLDPTLGDARD
ncbi:TetR/AcrR family transcriptional regulator [Mycolicibacterium sp. HS_4_1]